MSGVQSIERAFAILRVLARGPVGVTEIADRTELPKSTVSRLLAALETEGAVEQAEAGGGYSIGSALSTLGDAASPTATLRATVRPFIEELVRGTGGSAGFTVRFGDSAYWVDNVDDDVDELVTIADQTGQSFPMHSVPSGLALLSCLDDDELDTYLAVPLAASNEQTITDPSELRSRLERVGDDGLVVSREEVDAGVNAFAAPFRGPGGQWDGALYLQGPSFRFPGDHDEQALAVLVVDTAAELSAQLFGR